MNTRDERLYDLQAQLLKKRNYEEKNKGEFEKIFPIEETVEIPPNNYLSNSPFAAHMDFENAGHLCLLPPAAHKKVLYYR